MSFQVVCELFVTTSNAWQPSLAIVFILKLVPNALVHFGIKCSSFCAVNKGTSGRAPCASSGYLKHASVAMANLMLERSASLVCRIQYCTGSKNSDAICQSHPGGQHF